MNFCYILIAAFLSISASLFSQDQNPGVAILLNFDTSNNEYSKKVVKSFVEKLNDSKKTDFQFYKWEDKKDKLEYRVVENNSAQIPCDKIVFLRMNIEVTGDDDLLFTRDANKKITSAYFAPIITFKYRYKLVDIVTSKVELIDNSSFTALQNQSYIINRINVNHSFYFNDDPEKLKKSTPKEYDKILKKVKEEYDPKISALLNKGTDEIIEKSYELASNIKSIRDTRLFKIKNLDESRLEKNKKIKEFTIDAGLDDDLLKDEQLDVISKIQYGDYSDYLNLGKIRVLESAQAESECKTLFFSSKKLTNALADNEEIYISRSRVLLNDMNDNGHQKKPVAIDKDCIFCVQDIEKMLINIPGIEVIERNYGSVLSYFVELSKSDKYLDYNIDEIQGRQKGIRYILEIYNHKITATDVETRRIFIEESDNGWFSVSESQKVVLSRLFLKLFEAHTEIVQVLSGENKGKVRYFLAYHPFGFVQNEILKIYEISSEEVKGKSIDRKTEIGDAIVTKIKSDQFSEMYIRSGQKEVFQALQDNKQLTLINE